MGWSTLQLFHSLHPYHLYTTIIIIMRCRQCESVEYHQENHQMSTTLRFTALGGMTNALITSKEMCVLNLICIVLYRLV